MGARKRVGIVACRRTSWLVAALLTASAATPATALALPTRTTVAPGVVRRGPCSVSSRWRLRVTPDGTGSLVVRFALRGGPVGDTWNVYLDHDGVGLFAGSRIAGELGLVRVRRSTPDAPGVDVLRAAAHDIATGEICNARARI